MIQVTAALTGHREALLAGPALRSLDAAVAQARNAGLAVEKLIVLDRPDEITRSLFAPLDPAEYRLVIADGGDPALTRNRAVAEARGCLVTFLDADDLWSANWVVLAHAFCAAATVPVVAHSEMNVVFGAHRAVWWHADSLDPGFDAGYQRVANYWDAMCAAPADLLRRHPFRANALGRGYGHEDWHWNNMTLAAGIAHRPVPGTVHFKRRRPGTQMALCAERDVVAYPTALSRFPPAALPSGA